MVCKSSDRTKWEVGILASGPGLYVDVDVGVGCCCEVGVGDRGGGVSLS
jgi:hypothetical protein